MAVKKGLGKGLDTMIPKVVKEDAILEKEIEKAEGLATETYVKLSKIEPNRNQPRKNFDQEELESLAASLKQKGMISPIIVTKRKDHYEIVAGERRWRAAHIAGLTEIPVLIREYTEQEIDEISIIENVQREDLNSIEEANAYKRLMDEYKYTQEVVAEKMGKSRAAITNTLRLLKLSEKIQKMIVEKKLSEGHARALLAVEDLSIQEKLAQKVVDEKLSVRDIEKLVKNFGKPEKTKAPSTNEYDVFYKDIAESLKTSLGTKVSVSGKGDGAGKIEIEFYSNDELDRLVAKLK